MLYTAILDNKGRLSNVIFGRPHGNTKFTFSIDAERLIDAEREAQERQVSEWVRMQQAKGAERVTYPAPVRAPSDPRPSPDPVSRAGRCRCGTPKSPDSAQCSLCSAASQSVVARIPPAVQRDPLRECRLAEALDIQQQWQRQPNVGAFSKWLNERIALLKSAR